MLLRAWDVNGGFDNRCKAEGPEGPIRRADSGDPDHREGLVPDHRSVPHRGISCPVRPHRGYTYSRDGFEWFSALHRWRQNLGTSLRHHPRIWFHDLPTPGGWLAPIDSTHSLP